MDLRLAGVAGRQYGVISLDQLRALGLSRSAAQDRAESGRLHRIHHSVYSLMPLTLLGRNGRYMAAVLACGPEAVLSHACAAALHEIRRTDQTKIDVTVKGRSHRKHAGLDVHRSTTLTPGDVTKVHGIPCTTLARTILDLAQVIKGRPLERALDQAEILRRARSERAPDQIERNHRPAPPPSASAPCSTSTTSDRRRPGASSRKRSSPLCRRARSPMPEVNAFIDPRRRRPHSDPRGLRLARRESDCRDRRPRNPPHPAGVRGGPAARSAADRRRLDRDPHHLAPAHPQPERDRPPGSPSY